jgi:hypothetical protein
MGAGPQTSLCTISKGNLVQEVEEENGNWVILPMTQCLQKLLDMGSV